MAIDNVGSDLRKPSGTDESMVGFLKNRMSLYECPACDCLPVRYKKRSNSTPACLRCGRKLVKVSRRNNGYFYALLLSATGMGLLTLPDLINHVFSNMQDNGLVRNLQESLPPNETEARIAESLNTADLLSQLEKADLQWRPQEEILADGSTRYIYKRREGETDLSIPELRSLLESPPTFLSERQAILQLLRVLQRAGVRVVMAPTLKEGAAAEWDHRARTLRIQPRMAEKGSVDFLKVLSHEAIHVAQSCKAGALRSRPQALGLEFYQNNELLTKLKDPVYADASHWEKQLEMEAYATQHDPSAAKNHVLKQCLAS